MGIVKVNSAPRPIPPLAVVSEPFWSRQARGDVAKLQSQAPAYSWIASLLLLDERFKESFRKRTLETNAAIANRYNCPVISTSRVNVMRRLREELDCVRQ